MSNGKSPRSYGKNFTKDKRGRWKNKATGKYTSNKKLKGARSMRAKYGGTLTGWEKRLSEHYTEMRRWTEGDRFTEPILEYE